MPASQGVFVAEKEKNIFLCIRKSFSTFSPAQRKVADIILNRCSDVVKMSSHDIAKAVGVSPSTVVRFALELGYSGFKEMLNDLQSTVFVYSQAPMQKMRDSISEDEALENILQKVVQNGVKNLSLRKFAPLNGAFIKVMNSLVRAEKIYLIGARSSYCVVQYGGFALSNAAKNISYFSSSDEERYEKLNDLNEKDVLISVSFHRYYKDTVDAAAFAKTKGAFIVGITDSILSPIADYCDELLIAPNTSPFSSYLPAMAVMEAIILAFTQAKGCEARRLLDERMEVLLDNNVYAEIEAR